MKVLFGIGNPGTLYSNTYHNLGILFVDFLLKNSQILSQKNDTKYELFVLKDYYVIKSKVYMNCSFDALRDLYTFYKLIPQDVLVVHDELSLNKFDVNLKTTHGLNGHNGLRHIARAIGPDFFRLRFGIDHPKNFSSRFDVSDYVLSKLVLSEWENSFIKGLQLIDSFMK